MRFSVFASSAVAAIVGFGGTLALIIAAAQVLGATQAETASWVTAICLAVAAASAWLSIRYRMPIIAAWSTPGLALIGASAGFTMAEAVGAFIVTALALIATGLIRQLSVLVSASRPAWASGSWPVFSSFVIAAAKTVSIDPAFCAAAGGALFPDPPVQSIACGHCGSGAGHGLRPRHGPLARTACARDIHRSRLSGRTLPHTGAMIGIAVPLYLRHHGFAEPAGLLPFCAPRAMSRQPAPACASPAWSRF